jgi:hypothetical protein
LNKKYLKIISLEGIKKSKSKSRSRSRSKSGDRAVIKPKAMKE